MPQAMLGIGCSPWDLGEHSFGEQVAGVLLVGRFVAGLARWYCCDTWKTGSAILQQLWL